MLGLPQRRSTVDAPPRPSAFSSSSTGSSSSSSSSSSTSSSSSSSTFTSSSSSSSSSFDRTGSVPKSDSLSRNRRTGPPPASSSRFSQVQQQQQQQRWRLQEEKGAEEDGGDAPPLTPTESLSLASAGTTSTVAVSSASFDGKSHPSAPATAVVAGAAPESPPISSGSSTEVGVYGGDRCLSSAEAGKAGSVSTGDRGRASRGRRASIAPIGTYGEDFAPERRVSRSLPRDGRDRAAARAARQEADKVAALRYFAAEARREGEASKSRGGAGGGKGGRHHVRQQSASAMITSTVIYPREEEPMLCAEDSKAWRVLGEMPQKQRDNSLSSSGQRASSLPPRRVPAGRDGAALVNGDGDGVVAGRGVSSRSRESPSHRRSRSRGRSRPPPSKSSIPRYTASDGLDSGGIENEVAKSDGLDSRNSLTGGSGIGASVAPDNSEPNNNSCPPSMSFSLLGVADSGERGLAELESFAMTPRVPLPPLSPSAQTPPARRVNAGPASSLSQPKPMTRKQSAPSPGEQTPVGNFVGTEVEAVTTTNIKPGGGMTRSRSKSVWANRSVEGAEAEAGAEVSSLKVGSGDVIIRDDVSGRTDWSTGSACSTPKGTKSGSSIWVGGVEGESSTSGDGKRETNSLANKTPGRLPRRLHQGVNKVKRAVGVG